MKFRALHIPLLAIVFAVAGCAPPTAPEPPDNRAADEQALREADAAWSNAAATADGFLSYYTDDVTVLPPNEPIAIGKESARKSIQALYDLPGFSVKWQASKVEVARSGDIGYVHGAYEITMNDPAGKPAMDRGKFLEVWKKQTDGSWKCIVDMFNSDLPAAPPPPAK